MEKIDQGLYRILVPFEEGITTTVYVAKSGDKIALIDSATHESDVDEYIIPALEKAGVNLERVCYLLLTHSHGDHAGGVKRLASRLPWAKVQASFALPNLDFSLLSDGELILDDLRVISLPGHTEHCVGFLDERSKTLLSGDCLQLAGIGRYRKGIGNKEQYRLSIARLKNMDINRIVAAHEYDPLGSVAEGKTAVKEYLDKCLELIP